MTGPRIEGYGDMLSDGMTEHGAQAAAVRVSPESPASLRSLRVVNIPPASVGSLDTGPVSGYGTCFRRYDGAWRPCHRGQPSRTSRRRTSSSISGSLDDRPRIEGYGTCCPTV